MRVRLEMGVKLKMASQMFDSSSSQDVSRPWGPDGLRQELGLSLAKKMTRGCFRDYSAKHYPLKTLNGR
jgi:hypothetical protein